MQQWSKNKSNHVKKEQLYVSGPNQEEVTKSHACHVGTQHSFLRVLDHIFKRVPLLLVSPGCSDPAPQVFKFAEKQNSSLQETTTFLKEKSPHVPEYFFYLTIRNEDAKNNCRKNFLTS